MTDKVTPLPHTTETQGELFEPHVHFGVKGSDYVPLKGKAGRIIADAAAHEEPIFVLRAKDLLSIMALDSYVQLCEKYTPADADFLESLAMVQAEFRAWQQANSDKIRFPN